MRPLGKQIIVFLVLVVLFSAVPYTLILSRHDLGAGGGLLVRLLMWCPAFAAFATCALCRIDLASLGWNWRPARYEALAYVIPLLYAIPVYLACWIAIPGSFNLVGAGAAAAKAFGLTNSPGFAFFGLQVPLLASVGVIASLASTLGEEIGWRGFLLPRLTTRFGFTLGCFLSGCIWAVWHYAALLWANYNAGTRPGYALTCFTLMVISTAFILGWLRLKSGSLWPCALLHASHNLFIQAILDRLTNPVGRAPYWTTEFGAGLALTTAATALFFWLRCDQVNPAPLIERETISQAQPAPY